MIRPCSADDVSAIFDIINDAAEAYRGVIPEDLWKEPYMSMDYLSAEIADGVTFSGAVDETGDFDGVMGIQDRGKVYLIRHAYVRTAVRRSGIGAALLAHLTQFTDKPFLIGTWKAATWAISFYEKHGFQDVGPDETLRLLETYWSIPARQVKTSIVLADERWYASKS